MYEHADQSWRAKPRTIAPATVGAVADRVAEHAVAHGLGGVRVVLHGVEPLLLGAAGLRVVLDRLRSRLDPVTRLDLRMQSNGVLLTEALCELFVEYGVKVGISLDGDAPANDRHRRFANGASSHRQVLRALALLRQDRFRSAYAGILCTVDIANDPLRVYEALLAEQPPHIDLLLPHATWDHPPWRPPGVPAPYARWLGAIYDRWTADGRPTPIRMFDSLLSTAAGGPSHTEALGLDPADLVVIETDGTFEQVDSLKTAYDGAAFTGFDVFTHTVDEVAGHAAVAARQAGLDGLCQTCRRCSVVRQCGGGLFAHRYRTGSGFDNPSVYCADLKELALKTNATPARDPVSRITGLGPTVEADEIIDDLGSGYGTASSMNWLTAGNRRLVRALLTSLSRYAGEEKSAAAGWQLLTRLDETAPEAMRTVLAHPFLRQWILQALRAPHPAARTAVLPHLASVAAAVAVRAGVADEITVPVRSGALSLPTLGALDLPGHGDAQALLSTGPGRFTVRTDGAAVTVRLDDGSPPPPGWQPVRRWDHHGLSVALEDTDPYRDCYRLPPTARLGTAEADRWRAALGGAWLRIADEAPSYLPGLRALLHTVVALRPDPTGRFRSAAARHAFGAIAVTPAPVEALAVLLVHEVQHVKLGALLDVADLFDRGNTTMIRVPWRDDERPVEAVLQGTYAHLAVADVWRGRSGQQSADHFRRYRSWTATAIDRLVQTGALTPDGQRFVAAMRATLEDWPA